MKENFFKKLLLGTAVASTTLALCEQGTIPEQKPVVKTVTEQIMEDSVLLESAPMDLLNKALEHTDYVSPDSKDYRPLNEIIKEQKDWFISYIGSNGYRKRLIGELAVQLGLSETDPMLIARADKLIDARRAAVLQVKISENDKDGSGGYYPKSNQTREIQDGKPIVLEVPEHGVIKLGKGFQFDYPNQVVHELSHASTDTKDFGDGQIDSTERRQVEHSQPDIEGNFRTSIDAEVSYGYGNAPTEDHAHLDVVRRLLDVTHTYDPKSGEEFTLEHFKKMLKHPEILQDIDTHNLFRTTPKVKDLIWKMNHVS